MIENINAIVFGIDVNGMVKKWNRKTAEITGFSKEEALGKPLVSTFIKANARENVQSMLNYALQGNETSNFELEFEVKDGSTRCLLMNATTRRDVAGTITGVIINADDVTDKKKEEIAVAAVALEIRQLIDHANAPIFGIDVHGMVNEWNDKTAEITGFTKEDTFGRSLVSTFIKEKLRESVQSVLSNALQGNETSNYELAFETRSKGTRYLLVNATCRRDPSGNIVGVVGVAQDVTETREKELAIAAVAAEFLAAEKIAAQELQKVHEEYTLMLHNSPACVCSYDVDENCENPVFPYVSEGERRARVLAR